MKVHSQTKDFYLAYNFCDYPHMHSHSFWEFMIVTEGTYLHRINSASSFLTKNSVQVIRPADAHSIHALSSKMNHINLIVSAEKLKQQLDLLVPNAYETLMQQEEGVFFTIPDTACQSYVQKAISAQQYAENDPQHRYWVSQIFLSLVKDLFYHKFMKPDEKETSALPEYIQQIVFLLNDKKNFHLPLTDIVKNTSYSYVHISRSFKKYMKVSLSDYYLAVKINYARRLLEEGYTVAAASDEVGYSTQSHFNIAFKKFYNVTPIRYKKDWANFYEGLDDDEREDPQ